MANQNDAATGTPDPSREETQEVKEQTSPTEDSGRNEETSGEESTSASQDAQTRTPDKTELAEKREEGKLQQVQQEYQSLQEEQQKYIKWATKDPNTFKDALISVRGYSEDEADKAVEQLKTQGAWKNLEQSSESATEEAKAEITGEKQDQGTKQEPAADPYQAAAEIYTRREGYKKFFEQVPEMNPQNVKAEDRDKTRALAAQVEVIASGIVTANPNMDLGDALTQAYKIQTGKTDKELAKAREDGRLEGIAQARSNQSGTMPSPTGQQTTESTSASISAREKRLADQMGMTPEEWIKYGNQEETIVE